MKKTLFIFIISLISNASFAQWTTSGSNIYYNLGNIWIGNTAPTSSSTYNLEVYGSGPKLGLSGSVNGIGQTVGLDFNQQTTSTATRQGGAIKSIATGTYTWGTGATYAADLTFYTGFSNANVERMRILSTGNIGIGMNSPNSLLTVGGNPTLISGQQLGISYTPTAITGSYGGLTSQVNAAPTTNSSANFYGTYSRISTGSATGAINFTGRLVGVASQVALRGTGLASSICDFLALGPSLNSTGNATVSYGILINSQRAVGVSAAYGVYESGATDSNYFAGSVSIGTVNPKGYKLAVNGSAIATSMTVKLNSNWPDYVFSPGYRLTDLETVKNYIDQNHHLPELPSADDVAKNGLDLGEINKQLTKKVEELTLYLIEKDKQVNTQNNRLTAQQDEINILKKSLDALTKEVHKE